MNQLRLSQHQSILTLHKAGWSKRAIARELELNRETVSKYLRSEAKPPGEVTAGDEPPKPAISTPGSAVAEADSKPAISTAGSVAGRKSRCEAWEARITTALEQGLSAQRIYQDLVTEHQFVGSYQSVKRFVRRLGATTALPWRRIGAHRLLRAARIYGMQSVGAVGVASGADLQHAHGTNRPPRPATARTLQHRSGAHPQPQTVCR